MHDLPLHARAFGIELKEGHLARFVLYLETLWEWNRRMNLTGLSDPRRVVMELLLDSLITVPLLPDKGRLLDAGAGAGFPGIPLKIYNPRLDTCLVESNAKKISFLKHVIRRLGLDGIEAVQERIEGDSGVIGLGAYDMVATRAMAALPRSIAWCAPFLGPGGLLITYLGSHGKEELKSAEAVMERLGVAVEKVIPYVLPGKDSERNAVIFRKQRP